MKKSGDVVCLITSKKNATHAPEFYHMPAFDTLQLFPTVMSDLLEEVRRLAAFDRKILRLVNADLEAAALATGHSSHATKYPHRLRKLHNPIFQLCSPGLYVCPPGEHS